MRQDDIGVVVSATIDDRGISGHQVEVFEKHTLALVWVVALVGNLREEGLAE